MDLKKCAALKAELEDQEEPQCVPVARFFDGNDDEGSIGCNLMPHPGIEVFKKVLEGLSKRPDVTGVWVQINELDPGEESWPYSDLVVVAGKISATELEKAVEPLQADSVASAEEYFVSPGIPESAGKLQVIWWD